MDGEFLCFSAPGDLGSYKRTKLLMYELLVYQFLIHLIGKLTPDFPALHTQKVTWIQTKPLNTAKLLNKVK